MVSEKAGESSGGLQAPGRTGLELGHWGCCGTQVSNQAAAPAAWTSGSSSQPSRLCAQAEATPASARTGPCTRPQDVLAACDPRAAAPCGSDRGHPRQ